MSKRSFEQSSADGDNTTSTAEEPKIYHSATPIEDRASTFQAAFLPIDSSKFSKLSGQAASAHLQSLPAFNTATHRITAYRSRGAQKTISGVGILDLAHDDDGEKFAGKHLERMLDQQRVEGAICVARWYGGNMLGPVRFEHIKNAAKDVLGVWREEVEGPKRRKLEKEKEEKEKEELIQVFRERDQSIDVLRKMLAQKSGTEAAEMKRVEYENMSLGVLKKLERAKDKTIEMLLKKIDEVEKSVKEENGDARGKADELEKKARPDKGEEILQG